MQPLHSRRHRCRFLSSSPHSQRSPCRFRWHPTATPARSSRTAVQGALQRWLLVPQMHAPPPSSSRLRLHLRHPPLHHRRPQHPEHLQGAGFPVSRSTMTTGTTATTGQRAGPPPWSSGCWCGSWRVAQGGLRRPSPHGGEAVRLPNALHTRTPQILSSLYPSGGTQCRLPTHTSYPAAVQLRVGGSRNM